MEKITVLIIDEDPESIRLLTEYLNSSPLIEKVIWADTPGSAESQIICHNPDFIISDLGFPDIDLVLSGTECTLIAPFVLVASYYDNFDYLKYSREIGANALCLKDEIREALKFLIVYIEKGTNSSVFRNKFYLLK